MENNWRNFLDLQKAEMIGVLSSLANLITVLEPQAGPDMTQKAVLEMGALLMNDNPEVLIDDHHVTFRPGYLADMAQRFGEVLMDTTPWKLTIKSLSKQ